MPTLNEHIKGEPGGASLSLTRMRLINVTRRIECRGRDAKATPAELEEIRALKAMMQEIKRSATS